MICANEYQGKSMHNESALNIHPAISSLDGGKQLTEKCLSYTGKFGPKWFVEVQFAGHVFDYQFKEIS
jgi:hypothetical protein